MRNMLNEQEKEWDEFLAQLRENPSISTTLMQKAKKQKVKDLKTFWDLNCPKYPEFE